MALYMLPVDNKAYLKKTKQKKTNESYLVKVI